MKRKTIGKWGRERKGKERCRIKGEIKRKHYLTSNFFFSRVQNRIAVSMSTSKHSTFYFTNLTSISQFYYNWINQQNPKSRFWFPPHLKHKVQ